jgi:hypothetical protein
MRRNPRPRRHDPQTPEPKGAPDKPEAPPPATEDYGEKMRRQMEIAREQQQRQQQQ